MQGAIKSEDQVGEHESVLASRAETFITFAERVASQNGAIDSMQMGILQMNFPEDDKSDYG